MAPERSRKASRKALPDLLTVEEASAALRIGRTKAYLMAQEWRTTGGRSGLPVIDFGHVLRVPRQALEAMIGAELHGAVNDERGPSREERPPEPPPVAEPVAARLSSPADRVRAPSPTKPKSRAKRRVPFGQTTLPLTS